MGWTMVCPQHTLLSFLVTDSWGWGGNLARSPAAQLNSAVDRGPWPDSGSVHLGGLCDVVVSTWDLYSFLGAVKLYLSPRIAKDSYSMGPPGLPLSLPSVYPQSLSKLRVPLLGPAAAGWLSGSCPSSSHMFFHMEPWGVGGTGRGKCV